MTGKPRVKKIPNRIWLQDRRMKKKIEATNWEHFLKEVRILYGINSYVPLQRIRVGYGILISGRFYVASDGKADLVYFKNWTIGNILREIWHLWGESEEEHINHFAKGETKV